MTTTIAATASASGTNWSGNIRFSAGRVEQPSSVAELQELVAGARTVRALGSRHSFNAIADTPDTLVSLAGIGGPVVVDAAARTVTVPAGIRYGELFPELERAGLALHNTGSLPHISVIGACATGTHGSGVTNGNLSTAVSGLELMTADGELRTLRRGVDGDTFRAAALGLGCLGLVTRVTLDAEPAFRVRQDVFEDLPFAVFDDHAEELLAAGYSVSLFTLWREPEFTQVWVKQRLADGDDGRTHPDLFGARRADGPRHPVPGVGVESCTRQGGVPGPWFARLPHFRLEFTPSAGDELQSEYFLPRGQAVPALHALAAVREQFAPLLFTSEIRTIAADDLLMSPAYRQDSVAFHFTWHNEPAAVDAAVAVVERALDGFGPRPHWGKVFTTPPARLASLVPRIADFRAEAERLDPGAKFRNAFVDSCVWNR